MSSPPKPPASAAEAVERARASGPDRLPDRPEPEQQWAQWWYPAAEYELAVLGRIVGEGFAASTRVHYSDNYGRPVGRARFRRKTGSQERLLVVQASGSVSVTVAGRLVGVDTVPHYGQLTIPVNGGDIVELAVVCPPGSPAGIAESPIAPLDALPEWEYRLPTDDRWRPAHRRRGAPVQPHLSREPLAPVSLVRGPDGLWASEAPVLGSPVVSSGSRPRFWAGESRLEALASASVAEAVAETVAIGEARWSTRHPLAVAYLRVDGATPESVSVEATVRPAERRGAFYCSDDRLNRIWSTSAYTLRLCMQGLMVDGIKRDRMPWIGDQALAILANAYGFADGEIIRDGLVALGRARDGYVNGIADYSLWWVVAQETYLEHFADLVHLSREADFIHSFVRDLAVDAGADGVLRPRARAGAFHDAGPTSVFIDWGAEVDPERDSVALQMLWCRALRSAERVLSAVGHDGAATWGALADDLETTLRARGWDDGGGVWREYLDGSDRGGALTGYSNLLAVLAGVVPPGAENSIADSVAAGRFGTPFMRSFALLARIRLGDTAGVVNDISTAWGRMLDAGAQTFWEDFGSEQQSPLEMYGRPFGKSLCHGWAAAPVALLPRAVLGLRPLSDGWREFEVRPALDALEWASAVVPVAGGEIFVLAERHRVRVDVPAGHALIHRDGRAQGPVVVVLEADPVDW